MFIFKCSRIHSNFLSGQMPDLWRLEGGKSEGLRSLLSSGAGGQEISIAKMSTWGGQVGGDRDQSGSWQSSFLEQGNAQGTTVLRLQYALWVGMVTVIHVNN